MSTNTIDQMSKTKKGDWLRPEVRMHKEKEKILYELNRVLESSNATQLQRLTARENINAVKQEFLEE